MTDSHFIEIKQKLLTRLAVGEITQEEYEKILSEIERQETSVSQADTFHASSNTSEPISISPEQPQYHSMGDYATNPQAAFRISEGFQLGKYLLEKLLGRGGMGEVWKARDTIGERDVVIKVLPPELSNNKNELARIKDSFKKIQELNHEHICPTYDLGEHDQVGFYLVMKYLEAQTLSLFRRDIIEQKGVFPFELLCRIIHKIALGLDHAHSKRVAHRDIKPDNIMVADDGNEVWLIDFGLAAEIDLSRTKISLEVKMETCGTPPYMAPEQWKGKKQDAKTDQYSLAVIFYEMLTGELPYQGNQYILRQCVLNEPFPIIEDADESINHALAVATAKERKGRFENCSAFVEALQKKQPESLPSKTDPDLTHEEVKQSIESDQSGIKLSGDALRSEIPNKAIDKIPFGPILDAVAQELGKTSFSVRPEEYSKVKKLIIEASDIQLFDSLRLLPHLKTLEIKGCKSDVNLSSFIYLKQLRELKLSDCEKSFTIESREDIPAITTLKKLTISNCKSLKNLLILPFFQNLSEFTLTSCPNVNNILDLDSQTSLQELNLDQLDSVTDFSPLKNLEKLRSLSLFYDKNFHTIIDIVSKATELNSLSVPLALDMKDLDWLIKLPNLQDFVLMGADEITSVEPILQLKELNTLWLNIDSHAKLKDIRPLYDLKKLKKLKLDKFVFLHIWSIDSKELIELKDHLGVTLDKEEEQLKKKLKLSKTSSPQSIIKHADMNFDQLLREVRKNDVDAQYELARRYEEGIGVPKSLNDARKWFNYAAKQGHTQAIIRQKALNQRGGINLSDQAIKSNSSSFHQRELPQAPTNLEDSGIVIELDDDSGIYLESQSNSGVLLDEESALLLDVPNSSNQYSEKQESDFDEFDTEDKWKEDEWKDDEFLLANWDEYDDLSNPNSPRDFIKDSNLAVIQQKAIDGDKFYQTELGRRYQEGNGGLKKDLLKAYQWLRKAVDQKDPQACFRLANLLTRNELKEKKYSDAFKLYLMAAKQGHVASQFNAGVFCANGTGTDKDFAKAIHWYEKAANQGFKEAQFALGLLYKNGKGRKKNLSEAMSWFKICSEQGEPSADYELGDCLLTIDHRKALSYLEKAMSSDSKNAKGSALFKLGTIYYKGENGIQKDENKSVKYFTEGAKLGESKSQAALGYYYLKASVLKKNKTKGIEWLQKSAAQGNATAQRILNELTSD